MNNLGWPCTSPDERAPLFPWTRFHAIMRKARVTHELEQVVKPTIHVAGDSTVPPEASDLTVEKTAIIERPQAFQRN